MTFLPMEEVKFDINGQIKSIVDQNINKEVLGIDSSAESKIQPINQTIIDLCNSGTSQRAQLVSLQTAQSNLNSVVMNIDVTTRAGVSKVLLGFANQISSCDVISTGYLGLRSSICGGFSDSIIATYFSLYGCGIFLIPRPLGERLDLFVQFLNRMLVIAKLLDDFRRCQRQIVSRRVVKDAGERIVILLRYRIELVIMAAST